MKKNILRQLIAGFIIAFGVSLVMFLLLRIGFFRSLELKFLDYRFKVRGPLDVSNSNIIVVAIDDQTFKACKDRYPFPREYYAHLVKNLIEVGARLIVFDIQFTEPDYKNPNGDSLLAEQIKRAGNVILCGKIVRQFSRGGVYSFADTPIPILMETGSEWGVVGEIQDPDGFTRRYLIFDLVNNSFIYSIGMKVIFKENGLSPNPDFYLDDEGFFVFFDSTKADSLRVLAHRGSRGFEQTVLINYYGPAGTFPTYSLSSILDDSEFDLKEEEDTDYMELFKKNSIYPYELRIALLSDSVKQVEAFAALAEGDTSIVEDIIQSENPFKDKIVLVGVSIEELHDNKYTPFYEYGGVRRLMPGVETHAHAIQTILDGNYIKTLPLTLDFLLILIFCLITVMLVLLIRPVFGGLFTLANIALGVYLSIFLFKNNNTWLYITPVIAGVFVSYVTDVLYQFIAEQREKKKIRSMFQTYMSPRILRYLEEHPEAFSLKGEKREATMFFSDIAGFTTISETLPAEELAIVLNKYLSPMTEILMSYDGYVDKYEGDAIMCDFGVPVEDPDHAWKACWAALDQQEKLKELREEIRKDHGVNIYVRMGINSGIVSAGNMGSNQRFQYTVMGDAVNQASRFEGANKVYGTWIMIGETTYNSAKDKIEARVLDKLVVKGKTKPITVYELLSKKGKLDGNMEEVRDYFTKGLMAYWNRDWDNAIKWFQKAIRVRGDDPPSRVFIERCKFYKKNPPPPDWKGDFVMTTK
ncbi:MAG: adenylate/guanylate cyclase domain-containing protein [Candidatus Marinimicrobia bacterium]|nr:adenylate/guanylate cyclase domain-containing protein [Candidatus Neomarinimicrobiota bacterium]